MPVGPDNKENMSLDVRQRSEFVPAAPGISVVWRIQQNHVFRAANNSAWARTVARSGKAKHADVIEMFGTPVVKPCLCGRSCC